MPEIDLSMDRYHLPAEWEKQSGVMLTWPHANTDWAETLEQTEQVFLQIAAAITRHEDLLCVCNSRDHYQRIKRKLGKANSHQTRLKFAIADSNDSWARDHGPLTVVAHNKCTILDFQFDGWGKKYPASKDNLITPALVGHGNLASCSYRSLDLILEGGAVETDGAGTLLATKSSVWTRNPQLNQAELESRLSELLGLEHYLWLENGALSGDDTDGHIDTLARFTDQHTIVYTTAGKNSPDYGQLAAMREELSGFRDCNGQSYELIPLPPAGTHKDENGRWLPATYANFLIINDAVLLPIYSKKNDAKAIDILQDCFQDREIIPIDCRSIIQQNGSLHCLTMQFPDNVVLNSITD